MSSLENGLRILSLFGPGKSTLRVSEVSEELKLPKSSVSRLMANLADLGALERTRADTGYIVGPLTLSLYESYLKSRSLVSDFEVILEDLSSEFTFTALASYLTNIDIVLLNAKYGSHPLRIVQPIGQRLFSGETAMGKCLLARLGDDEVKRRFTLAGRRLRPELLTDLQAFREAGYVCESSLRTTGIETIASAVVASTGDSLGFCLIYPAVEGAGAKGVMIRRVLEVAKSVGRRVGDLFWLHPPI